MKIVLDLKEAEAMIAAAVNERYGFPCRVCITADHNTDEGIVIEAFPAKSDEE